jgi:ribosome-associated translation inhibitor RaiA
MQIQINTDHTIVGRESLNTHVRSVVEGSLSRFSGHITRVEVHVTDENGTKTVGDDNRCVMEARLEGLPPFAVTQHAENDHLAIEGAAEKLTHLVEHTVRRSQHERNRRTDPDLPGTAPAIQA